MTLPTLCQALQDHVRHCVLAQALDYVLIAHDWSWLNYQGHTTKPDRKANSNQGLGYALLSALALSSQTGAPLAPVSLALESGEGVYTSWEQTLKPAFLGHQEALWAHVQAVEALHLPARCVPIVDREADSVQPFRAFAVAGHLCLIRAKDNQYVEVEGRLVQLRHLVSRLRFTPPRAVLYRREGCCCALGVLHPPACGVVSRAGGSTGRGGSGYASNPPLHQGPQGSAGGNPRPSRLLTPHCQ